MSDTFSKVEVITGVARRRRFPTEQKLAVVAETMQPGMSISYVARQHGLSPSLVFRWRRLMSEGGKEAIRADEDVVPASEARKLEERVRELERLLGRKTMEVEILKCRNVRIGETLLASKEAGQEVSRWIDGVRKPRGLSGTLCVRPY